jgi:hypothetical protein
MASTVENPFWERAEDSQLQFWVQHVIRDFFLCICALEANMVREIEFLLLHAPFAYLRPHYYVTLVRAAESLVC